MVRRPPVQSVLPVMSSLALVVLVMGGGCSPDVEAFVPAGPDATSLLAAVGPSAVGPALSRLVTEAKGLSGAAGGGREGAQDAWRKTMAVWQELEAMQLGPAANSRVDPGGQDLRAHIYSWPSVNPCRVDLQTLGGRWDEEGFFNGALVEAYGLDALEHLLFAGPELSCQGRFDDGPDAQWDALGEDGVAGARSAYDTRLAADLVSRAQALADLWAAGDAGFPAQLAAAGSTTSPYASQAAALRAILSALDYQRAVVTTVKLGGPLGVDACGAAGVAPTPTELAASGQSLAAVKANLAGFRTLFTGGDGAGLDDHLTAGGEAAVVEAVNQALSAAQQAADAIEDTLQAALADDVAPVTALHSAVGALGDLLRVDLPAAMGVDPPLAAPCSDSPAPAESEGEPEPEVDPDLEAEG